MKHLLIFLTLLTCTYSNFIINPYVIATPEPVLPTANLVAHYQPSGISRHGFSTNAATSQLDTAQKKVGVSSLLLDGNSDYVDYADHADWNMGLTGTVEMWVRLNTAGVDMTMISQVQDASNFWEFTLTNSATRLQFNTGFFGADLSMVAVWTPSAGTWYHIAATLNAGTNKLWIDGVDTTLIVDTPGIVGMPNITGDVEIGANASADFFDGWIDDLMLSNSAKYTVNFTPAQPLLVTANTKLYMAFEGTDTSTRIFDGALSTAACSLWVDDSGNEHDMTQTTGANQADGTASALDGHTGLTFNGSTDFYEIPDNSDMDQTGNITIVMVFKTTGGWILTNSHGGSFFASTFQTALSGGKGFFRRGQVASEWDVTGVTNINDSVYRAVSFIDNGTSMEILLNNVTDVDSTPGGYGTPTVNANPIDMGRRAGNNDSYFNGVLVEVYMYDANLSASIRTQLNDYIQAKYPSIP